MLISESAWEEMTCLFAPSLGIPSSTLSHHISALVSVGLVTQNRESRTLMCVSQYEILEAIIEFLREECCVNSKTDVAEHAGKNG
ncbi:ArsR/SmtB family transcription factor [Escherichia coli]|uniref:ArsR/SmtB family transcription factor n=1 Tax=Escherichia coli TaxID=562 RepID=UPI0038557A35